MKTSAIFSAAASLIATAAAGETIWLVNSSRGSEISSGFAYYSNYQNPGPQPQDYIDVVHGRNQQWEGSVSSATFNSGVTFTVDLPAGGHGPGSRVGDGKATGPNYSFTKNYKCYQPQTQNQQIYTVDGWAVHGIYLCQS